MNCTEKFIKHSERVGARFAEQNAGMSLLYCLSTLDNVFLFRSHEPAESVVKQPYIL